MSLQALKERLLNTLSQAEKNVRFSNINDIESDIDPIQARKSENEHRKAAYGQIDIYLERGMISAEEAEIKKAKWDVLNGY